MERLLPTDQQAGITMEHLESFAKDGLRTLCLGYRVLTAEEYTVRRTTLEYADNASIDFLMNRNGWEDIVQLQQQLTIEMNWWQK